VGKAQLTHLGTRSRVNLIFRWDEMALERALIGAEARRNMSRIGILTAFAFIATITSVLADDRVWTIGSWPGDIDLIPCSAWTKNGDGGWVLTGGSIKLGSETMSNIGVKGDAAAHKLDRECGGAKKK
jgi:hypothetical protein